MAMCGRRCRRSLSSASSCATCGPTDGPRRCYRANRRSIGQFGPIGEEYSGIEYGRLSVKHTVLRCPPIVFVRCDVVVTAWRS